MLFAMTPPLRDMMESFGGRRSWLSTAYKCQQTESCLRLLKQLTVLDLSLALVNAGSSIAARMAMMAITTSSSMSVNPGGGSEVTPLNRSADPFRGLAPD